MNSKLMCGRRLLFLNLILFALIFCTGAGEGLAATLKRQKLLMGTKVSIILCGPEQAVLEKAAQAAFATMEQIEGSLSSWRQNSEISKINRSAGIEPVVVSPDLFALIRKSIHFSGLSKGCFDISWKGLGDLWDLRSPDFQKPVHESVTGRLHLVDYRKILLDNEAGSVLLGERGMKISLGGIGKGYSVDMAVKSVRSLGVENGIVDAGGDLKAFGRKESGELWTVGIKNPRDEKKVMCVIPLSNVAVATSGDYERYRMINGTRYHHILDPRNGYPARGCMSTTVVARDVLDADALATSVFVMGPDEGLALLEQLPDIEGVIVDSEGKLRASSGLATAE